MGMFDFLPGLFKLFRSKKFAEKKWLICLNGEIVGLYYGPDLNRLKIEYWIDQYPEDPNPIQLIELEKIY